VTAQAGIDTRRWALSVVAADLRGTGYPDLFIANDYGVSELYFNEGGKRFREVGKETGVGFSPKSGMNAAVGDVMNNGQFAVYVSNIWEDGVLVQGNNLWMPQEGTAGDDLKFDNLANSMGVENGGWSFGAQFGDLNNDGTQDIYLVNGYISADKKQDYWYDYSKITVGNSSIISDASRWPPMKGRSLGGYQQKKVWINDGKGRFTEVAQGVGVTDVYDGRSVALADFWNRGVLDAVVANHKGPLLLYKNTAAPDNQWIALELEGSKSNRSAVGAQVKVYWNGQQQVQEIQGGSGFCAQNQRRLHFGLGKNANLEKVVIRWPSGKDQELSKLELNQLHSIKEPL
jgi:enediyne biosynthesis protein E4